MGGVAAGRDPKKRPGVQDDPSCEEALLRSFGGGGESGGLGCEVIGKLGEGSEGVVYVVQERGEGGKRFAVKAFKARNKQGVSTAAVREVKLLRELKHDNVVRLRSVHVAKPERRVFLSYECCSTDLQQLIRRHHANRDPIPEYTVKSALWQLLRALDYLHSSWVVHRDVKPENVLVDRETGACKIADFGCAKVFRNDPRALRQSTGAVVTLWYRAPELLLGCSDYSPAIDVWALGCVFAEMLRLRPLFHSEQRKGNRYARVLSVCVCVRISKSKNVWQNRADSPPPLSLSVTLSSSFSVGSRQRRWSESLASWAGPRARPTRGEGSTTGGTTPTAWRTTSPRRASPGGSGTWCPSRRTAQRWIC